MLRILKIQKLSILQKVLLFGLIMFGVTMLSSGKAHAATLNVATGADETTTNSSCSLSEAIENISNQAQTHTDCLAGDGANDTITIPAGTITLVGDLPTITESVTIQGAGMTTTIIDGNGGQYNGFSVGSAGTLDIDINNIQITSFNNFAISIFNCNVTLSTIEIYGQNVNPARGDSILITATTSGNFNVELDNIYAHTINSSSGFSILRIEEQGNGGTIDSELSNITLSDIHGTAIGDSVFGIIAVAFGGTLNTSISNVTVNDFTGTDNAVPFGSFGAASSSTAIVNTQVQNVTIIGLRGKTGTGGSAGVKSAAFYSASAAFQPGDQARSTVNVTNSLMADNINDSTSSNCTALDMTGILGGTGTDSIAVINSLGYNVSDDASCTSFTETGDQQNISNILSTIGPLQNNGGLVPTRALLAGSPAIASGGAVLGVSTDTRGVARDSTCPSVGAYEYENAVCGVATSNPVSPTGGGSLADTGQGINSVSIALVFFASTTILIVASNRDKLFIQN